MLPDNAAVILKLGSARIRVRRAGMMQFVIFKVRRIKLGGRKYPELYSDRVIDVSEVQRVADETSLPVEAQNGVAFPAGKGAKDFLGM